MAQHRVVLNAPTIPVGNADFVFQVFQQKKKFGRLKISKGGIVFMPANKSSKKFSLKRIGWNELYEYTKNR
jgi:hypothetical protein